MKSCTYGLSLDALLTMPKGLLVLHGAEGDPVEPDPNKADKDAEGDNPDGDEDDDDKSKGGKAAPDAKDKRIAGLEQEKDRHAKLRAKAESKVTELQSEIDDLKKNGVTDEATKTELSSLKDTVAKQAQTINEMALKNAFLENNTFKWKSAKAALKLADLSEVEVDEKGAVHGLDSALAKLAKDEPYLLETADDADKDKDKKPAPRKTGDPAKPAPNSEAAKKAAELKLKRKYPALRR